MNAVIKQLERTCQAQSRDPVRIGIVGGGPGGLMTAYLLQHKLARPVCVSIWEAASRLGGKIKTARFDSAPVTYEVGAAEFYDYSPVDEDPLKELILELGLSIAPMGGNSVVIGDQVLSNLDDVSKQFGPSGRAEIERFYHLASSLISPTEFYASQSDEAAPLVAPGQPFQEFLSEMGDSRIRHYVETLIHSDLAAEPRQTNVTYGLHNYLMNDARYMQLYGIVGGNEQLVSALAGCLQAEVHLDSKVRRIQRTATETLAIDVETQGPHNLPFTEQHEYDYLILALPLDAYGQLEFDGMVLNQAIQRHVEHFHHPAHYLRISILFERPFWNGILADSFCMLEAFGGCCLYDESSRSPESPWGVLGWLLGGDAAVAMAGLSDAQLIAQALESLPAELEFGRGLFREGKVHRWIGAVNAMPGGASLRPMELRHNPEPRLHSNLFVVGDYLFDSTINGVLESADFVSDWIAARVNATND